MSIKLTTDQLQTLGLGTYATERSREALMERIGRVVFDGAMVQLLASLNEEQVHALNYAIESCDSFACVMDYVERVYPQFSRFLEVEQTAFVDAYVAELQATA